MSEGQPGKPGEPGEPGTAGGGSGGKGGTGGAGGSASKEMTPSIRRSFILLVLLTVVLTAISIGYSVHINSQSRARDVQIARQSAAIFANAAHIRVHEIRDAQLRAALCGVLPSLIHDAAKAARPDFAHLAVTLDCKL
jgi:hypothetical protein